MSKVRANEVVLPPPAPPGRNSVRRSRTHTTAMLVWPLSWRDWDDLPTAVRNRLRDLMDEAVDIIEEQAAP